MRIYEPGPFRAPFVILARAFEVQDGDIIVPEAPGNGIAWNEETVKRFAA